MMSVLSLQIFVRHLVIQFQSLGKIASAVTEFLNAKSRHIIFQVVWKSIHFREESDLYAT